MLPSARYPYIAAVVDDLNAAHVLQASDDGSGQPTAQMEGSVSDDARSSECGVAVEESLWEAIMSQIASQPQRQRTAASQREW